MFMKSNLNVNCDVHLDVAFFIITIIFIIIIIINININIIVMMMVMMIVFCTPHTRGAIVFSVQSVKMNRSAVSYLEILFPRSKCVFFFFSILSSLFFLMYQNSYFQSL